MSAAQISFGTGTAILASGPVQFNDAGGWANGDIADASMARKSKPCSDGGGLNSDAACEADLVSVAKSGDQRAFLELCRRLTPLLKRRIRRIVRNCEDAEDILQDTLKSAFQHLHGFRADCSFKSWVMTIATNQSLMLLRKRRVRAEVGFGMITAEGRDIEVFQISDPLPNPEQVYARRQANLRMAHAVKLLPAGFRLLVERYHQDEIKLRDAARAMGITEAAAKSRLLRARKALRRYLHNDRSRYLD